TDRGFSAALGPPGNPWPARLQPIFSSDIGHWDVPDISAVLLESHRLVDKGILTDADYRDFVFTYPAQLHLKANPDFFANTSIATSIAKSPILVPPPSKGRG